MCYRENYNWASGWAYQESLMYLRPHGSGFIMPGSFYKVSYNNIADLERYTSHAFCFANGELAVIDKNLHHHVELPSGTNVDYKEVCRFDFEESGVRKMFPFTNEANFCGCWYNAVYGHNKYLG